MSKAENSNATERMKIEINGKKVNLIFQSEPNVSAAEFIRKTLINAYTMKAVYFSFCYLLSMAIQEKVWDNPVGKSRGTLTSS